MTPQNTHKRHPGKTEERTIQPRLTGGGELTPWAPAVKVGDCQYLRNTKKNNRGGERGKKKKEKKKKGRNVKDAKVKDGKGGGGKRKSPRSQKFRVS